MEPPKAEEIVSTSSKGLLDDMIPPATPPAFTASNFLLLPPIMKNPATKEEKVFIDFDTGCPTTATDGGSSCEDDFWVLVHPRGAGSNAKGGLIAPRRSSQRTTDIFSPIFNSRHCCDANKTCESLSEFSPVASPTVANGDVNDPPVLHLKSSSSPRTTIQCAPCFAPIQNHDDSTRIRDTYHPISSSAWASETKEAEYCLSRCPNIEMDVFCLS